MFLTLEIPGRPKNHGNPPNRVIPPLVQSSIFGSCCINLTTNVRIVPIGCSNSSVNHVGSMKKMIGSPLLQLPDIFKLVTSN